MDTTIILRNGVAEAMDLLQQGRAFDAFSALAEARTRADFEERCEMARKAGIAPGLRLPEAVYASDGALVLIAR